MTLDGTRTFVIGRERPVVVDPGPADQTHHAAVLAALNGAAPVAILVTHDHLDHAEGAAPLAAATGAAVFRGRQDSGGLFQSSIRPLEDDQRFDTDVGVVRAIATPGHSRDHFAFAWQDRDAPAIRALFAGDLMMGEGDTALVAWPDGDIAAYLASLERIRKEEPTVILPAHGPPISRPDEVLDRYRRHRLQRVQQTLDVLRAFGPSTADELVDAVYGERLDPRLRTAAQASLTAALEFLCASDSVLHSAGGRFIAASGTTSTPVGP